MAVKKLIEVALPLEKINAESAREKSIRHGHPSTLHLWWARRPLAAARAVIWASLVDDPSSHPELFPTEEDQNKERQRLFKILEDLVVWENANNETVLNLARAEILKSTGNNPPALLDPFAGGGAIPLEAQRLGLEAHAHDLNPVAVMINKAMIEIPPRFADCSPVNPSIPEMKRDGWKGAAGLAEDVRYYGEWMKQEAFKRIGHLYPKVKIPDSQGGGEATVIAWLWARTLKCPNPACNCQMPLFKSTIIAKNIAYIDIHKNSEGEPVFEVKYGVPQNSNGTVNRRGAHCIFCGTPVSFQAIRESGKTGKIGAQLMAVVAKGKNGRVYVSPNAEHRMAAECNVEYIDLGRLANYPGYLNPPAYGLETFESLFTNRQLYFLTTLGKGLSNIAEMIQEDAANVGMERDVCSFEDGGRGTVAYSNVIITYLAFMIDKIADYNSSICSWHAGGQKMRNTFGLTGMSMTWDYAEANPFSGASGSYDNMLDWVVRSVRNMPIAHDSEVSQFDAQVDCGLRNVMVSTDPPYYSNVPYAGFADFFYVWLRQHLRNSYKSLFSTMLTPKGEELVADPYRLGSKKKAAEFFETGMLEACKQIFCYSRNDIPVTIYYAFKESDVQTDDEKQSVSSTGWETMLNAIIKAGFAIAGTWPMRTEMSTRTRGVNSNALASSIVLVCKKRPDDELCITRRNFINELKREMKPALQKLKVSNIAPVDLAQSAIGPGMAVFSKYSQVLEADGTPMTIRSALQIINQELDMYFNEQDGELDSESRFCVDLYSQVAFNEIKTGDAFTLARAKNIPVELMVSHGTVYAQKGVAHLMERPDLPESINEHEDCIWLLCQQLTHKMEKEGVGGCAKVVAKMFGSNAERAKDLAYRLYTIAERKHWAQEAYAYNALVVAWPEIQSRAAEMKVMPTEQMPLF